MSESGSRGAPGGGTSELPMVAARIARSRGADLARGLGGLVYWGAPIAVLLVASALGESGLLPFWAFGILLVGGTLWFGLTCLLNAVRCGRTHCWIDGTLLPILAAVGALNLLAIVHLSWPEYTGILWGIVLLSFVAEWLTGPYVTARPSVPSA